MAKLPVTVAMRVWAEMKMLRFARFHVPPEFLNLRGKNIARVAFGFQENGGAIHPVRLAEDIR